MNMHISNANNQVHELAPPTCVLLLSKNIDPPQYCSSWSMFMIALSSPPLSSKDNSYLCSFLSPFVINDHKKGRDHMKFAMWRSMTTTWSCTSCTCRVTTWIPLVGNHMKRLWFDTKSWTWVDGWVFIFYGHFQVDWNWHHLNTNMWKHGDHLEMPHVGY